jgi:hypothetical protein
MINDEKLMIGDDKLMIDDDKYTLNHRFLVNVTLRKYCGISYNVYEVVP